MTIDWDIAPLPRPEVASPEAAALKAAVMRLPEERFAVLDGALFDDLVAELSVHGLAARPLFLEAGGPQAVASGPFLLALKGPADIDRLLAFNGARRSPVFWSWSAGEAALYRHLRTLNLAEIPNENRVSDYDPAYEAVIFRHWDGVVLGQMLPLLRPGQIARFLGAGAGVCFDAGVAGGLTVQMRSAEPSPPETGVLRFSSEQIGGISNRRLAASRISIATYLRNTRPAHIPEVDEPTIRAFVLSSEVEARILGVSSEAGYARFAWLMLATNGTFASLPQVRDYMALDGITSDEKVRNLMHSVAVALTGRVV